MFAWLSRIAAIVSVFVGMPIAYALDCDSDPEGVLCKMCLATTPKPEQPTVCGGSTLPENDSVCSIDPIGQDCVACLAKSDQAGNAAQCGDRLALVAITVTDFQCPTSKSQLEALGPIALRSVRDYLVAAEQFKASLRPFEQSNGANCEALPEYFLSPTAPPSSLEIELENASALPQTIHQCLVEKIDFFTVKSQENPQDRFFLGALVDLTSLQIDLEAYMDRLNRAFDEVEAKRENIANQVESCHYR